MDAVNLNFEDATVSYYKDYLNEERAQHLFAETSELFSSEQNNMICDNEKNPLYRLNRKTIVFIDDGIDKSLIPKIWGDNVTVLEFTPALQALKSDLESKLDYKFNVCLANYYLTGKKSIGWHSDSEEKGSTSCIASISLGSTREFAFRQKNSCDVYAKQRLGSGSLLVMGPGCQENYQHRLLVDKTCHSPRLNLTFRLFDSERYGQN